MSVLKPKGYLRSPLIGAVKLYSKVVFGASGAVSSQTAAGESGFTVSKPDATTGIYRVTTADKWAGLLHVNGIVYNAGTARGQSVELKVKYGASTAKVFDLHLVSDAGAAEDGNSGDELWLEITMTNTDLDT